ncbi:hypothetical protein AB0C52_18180 [Streptomyces sp. NPDC048717]|uniref:hypothetical protein n=1 Tax=Streptomyces sp. NPDC048717 TaxID=3154928 RepID=UPI00343D7221
MTIATFNVLPVRPGRATADTSRPGRGRRWQGRLLMGAALALLPWTGYLAGTLPPAEAAAWIALDALEAAALFSAGSLLSRFDPRHRAPAAAAALLLLADACADLATAAPGPERAVAAAMAVAAELPLAALCGWLAARPTPAPAPVLAPERENRTPPGAGCATRETSGASGASGA